MTIDPRVQQVLDETDGNTYVSVRLRLVELGLPQERRDRLEEMHHTSFMQTGRLATVVVPRKHVDEIASWDDVIAVTEIRVY